MKLLETHSSTVDAGATLEECARRCISNCSFMAYAAADIRGGDDSRTVRTQSFSDLMDTRFVEPGHDLFVRLARPDLGSCKKTRT